MLSVGYGKVSQRRTDPVAWSRHQVLMGKLRLPGCTRLPLCRLIEPMVDGSTKVTVYVPPVLRKLVIQQCHDTDSRTFLLLADIEQGEEILLLGRSE